MILKKLFEQHSSDSLNTEAENAINNDDKILATQKIPQLMFRLAIPSVIAQLVNILYNLVDRMYIGRMEGDGVLALTGLGLCFPILMIILSFSAFVVAGGAPLAAIELGKNNRDKAEKILGNGVVMLLCFSILLTSIFMIYKRPLLFAFGASENTIGYADDYLSISLLGTFFALISMGLSTFIYAQGKAKTAMLSTIIGAVTNIVLDPIFIFYFGMGVKGAALATIISQFLSAVWILLFLISDKSAMRIRIKKFIPDKKIMLQMTALGIAAFVVRITESLISIVLTRGLQHYGGDLHVGSITILQSVMFIITAFLQGLCLGVQPIISYNYGAMKQDRVKETIKLMMISSFLCSCIFCIAIVLFPTVLARMFTNEMILIDLLKHVMPIYFSGIWLFGVLSGIQYIFMGLGQAKSSIIIVIIRKFILLIPLALVLPLHWGVMGIYYAEPISDIASTIIACILLVYTYKKVILSDITQKER